MNPAVAHRLLNAPTAVWAAYQTEDPHWGHEIAQCLRAGTVSPLAVTNNLRKLTDCMADPEIQPLLCDWFMRHFAPSSGSMDTSDRVQAGLGKCIRALQLQAIAQNQRVNILGKIDNLAALSGNPLTAHGLWHSWMLEDDDIYTTDRRSNEYFTNGKSLGNKANVRKVLSQYQKFLVEAMVAVPEISKDIKDSLHLDLVFQVNGQPVRMAHALLWENARLSSPVKYALAHDWLRDTSTWATRSEDEKLSPQKTRHWRAWGLHAETYLQVSGVHTQNLHDVVEVLKNCPPLPKPVDELENIDGSVFNDMSSVLS